MLFLLGDSPPKTEYRDDVDWTETCKPAVQKDIVINTIQMGNNPSTTPIWKEIANRMSGQFLAVDQRASDVAIETPFDKEIGELADKLDASRIYYGSEEEQKEQSLRKEKAVASSAKSGSAAKARRGSFSRQSAKRAGGQTTFTRHSWVDVIVDRRGEKGPTPSGGKSPAVA